MFVTIICFYNFIFYTRKQQKLNNKQFIKKNKTFHETVVVNYRDLKFKE